MQRQVPASRAAIRWQESEHREEFSEQPSVTEQQREAGADVPQDVKTDPQSENVATE